MAHYFVTKRLGSRSGSTVLYLPKEWGITPNEDVTFMFWNGGEAMPPIPYKLRITPKKMNDEGAIGIYLPTQYVQMVPEDKLITAYIITGEGENGNA